MTNALLPFLINEKPIRGRMIRLEGAVDEILRQHDYPERISRLLAEALTFAAILSSNLKTDGIVTLQLQSKGDLSLLVADSDAQGNLRGYAQFDETANLDAPLSQLCAQGYVAITLDTGAAQDRYQGIVPLEGQSIAQSMQHYFAQSQQLQVKCHIAVGQQLQEGQMRWVAGGMYLEHMPESAEASVETDDWREARLLLETLKDDELLDTQLPGQQLLYRLFHESGVWVYDAKVFKAYCRCSREKIESALKGMSPQALEDVAQEGKIDVDCQFCGNRETFTLGQLRLAGS